jgi:hypothetical protein
MAMLHVGSLEVDTTPLLMTYSRWFVGHGWYTTEPYLTSRYSVNLYPLVFFLAAFSPSLVHVPPHSTCPALARLYVGVIVVAIAGDDKDLVVAAGKVEEPMGEVIQLEGRDVGPRTLDRVVIRLPPDNGCKVQRPRLL